MSSVPRYDFTINVKTKKCCCCKFATFIDAELTLCNHWVVKPLRPILISTYFLILFATAIADVFLFSDIYDQIKYNNFKINLPWVAIIVIFVLFICTTSSFYAVMCRGPGYAPYDWSVKKDVNISFEETVKRFAVYQQQVDFAKAGEQPPRSCFSTPARRFILRADHYCAWMTNWIGLKNQRYFIIFLFYGSIVLFSIFLITLSFLHYHYSLHSTAFYIFALSASGFFSIFIGLQLLQQVYNATFNTLTMELIKQMEPFYSRGTLNNWEEVCGSSKYICLWPFPCYNHKPIIDGFDFPDYPYPIKNMPKRLLLEEEDEKDTNSNVDTNNSQEDLSNNDKFEIDTNIL